MVEPRESFRDGGSHTAGKCYSEIGFGKYSTSLENNDSTDLLR